MRADPGPLPPARWRLLAELRQPDLAVALAAAVRELDLPAARLAQLQTAVAEAGRHARPLDGHGQAVQLHVLVAAGADTPRPGCAARGWGFFIVETSGLELFLYREGELPVNS